MINNIKESLPIVKELIEEKTQDNVIEIKNLNEGKHYIFTTRKGLKYYLLYKRDFFYSFGQIFNLKGAGESINESYLNLALKEQFGSFVICYSNGNIYTISPQEWKNFAVANNTIRTQNNGIEKTYSVPLSLLRRWK